MAVETIYHCVSGEPTHGAAYGGIACGSMQHDLSDAVVDGFTTRCSEGGTAGSADCTAYVWADVELLSAGDLVPTVGGPLRDFASITWGFDVEEPPPSGSGAAGVLACDGELEVTEGVPYCSGEWTLEESDATFTLADLDKAELGAAWAAGFVVIATGSVIGIGLSLVLKMIGGR